jgi:hypothetical protein
MNREAWLTAMVEKLRPPFRENGYELPTKVRVSCGWPSIRGRAAHISRVGEAWYSHVSADGTSETFISPRLSDPIEVADVLVHEMVHHAVGPGYGHKGPFRRLARAVGLTGKMPATVVGPALRERLHARSAELGPYPHSPITGSNERRQSTRMLKVVRVQCGCTLRMARCWIDTVGTPTCACSGRMEAAASHGRSAPGVEL